MKSYIPHRLLVINDQIIQSSEDPVFMESFRLAFDWANTMGLENKRVFGFYIQKPSYKNPLDQQTSVWCKIECSEEERKIWDETKELQIKQAVYDMLKDDE